MQLGYILPIMKKPIKLSVRVTIISVTLFAFTGYGSVSFEVPEDHEDFPFLDSLYTQIVRQDRIVKQKEKKYLKDPLVLRQKKFAVKEEYFNALVSSKTITKKTLLSFYAQLETYYKTRRIYFEKLLSILKGDDRAPCFALYKQARDNYADVQRAILKYTPQEIKLLDKWVL